MNKPFTFLKKMRRAWAFCFPYFFIEHNGSHIGDSWRFSRQFWQGAVIFSFFLFFFCARG